MLDPLRDSLQKYVFKILQFIGFGTYKPPFVNPDLTDTEISLLEVVNEPKFSAYKKAKMIDKYHRGGRISDDALLVLVDRMELIESLKTFYRFYRTP